MTLSEIEFINTLRQASSYVQLHNSKLSVIYLPGELILDTQSLEEFAEDISHLHALGLKLIIVMGATPQIDLALKEAQVEWQSHEQFRITTSDMLPALQNALGKVRSQLEAAFSRQQLLDTHPLALCSGNWVTAQPKGVIKGIDYQYTGQVRKINAQAIQAVLDSGQVALLTPLAYSLTGEVFNLNTLEQACNVADKLEADKLLIFTNSEQMQELPRQMSFVEMQNLPAKNLEQKQLLTQLYSIKKVKRIHLLNEQDPSALLYELYSRDGIGTLIFADRYHQLRSATIEDINSILELIKPLEEAGMLVKRSKEKLELEISNYLVAERDNHIIGCAALYPFENSSAEIASFAISPSYQNQGLGEELLNKVVEKAVAQNITELFLLTTHTYHWFIEHGFKLVDLDKLPPSKKNLYNYQRQSKVLIKKIS